jgi:hypothetical protein
MCVVNTYGHLPVLHMPRILGIDARMIPETIPPREEATASPSDAGRHNGYP